MSAKPKPEVDPYADETSPFVGKALWDDLDSDNPSPEAIAWARRQHEKALADPRPPLTSEQLGLNLLARHEARLKRDQA
ncbi:hypothetical protein ASG17_03815 [Brevundimonas sp. Leaf363]|uniref:hypothetical protein n=1 Tax=Brevundimonas sp. Leaf363 TaxID=1736353 RepID=UPI0006FDFC02|nr:hypothetical protein [Brevundimonas sp. Leaf363]KQS55230.1 hypothetical protein ASG17_03815 [Brevundimonas sp. Leaf363]